jgi:hypothetical protein
MDWGEACRILGVPESATAAEIKEQYIYKVQLLHPDKNQEKPENVRKKAESELALINQAYGFLNNPNNNPYKIPPKLAVEPVGIRFREVNIGEKKSTTLTIRNAGGPYTSIWIDNQPAPWLVVTAVKSITGERLPLEVTLEATGTGAPGQQYFCDLLVKLENENTGAIDQLIVKIELYTGSVTAPGGVQPGQSSSLPGPSVVVPRDKPAPRPGPVSMTGFSLAAFLVNLLAFSAVGSVTAYLVNIFFKPDQMIFIIALIIYAVIAVGVSVNYGITVGSRTGKARNNNPQPHP